eukprot:scaffold1084_cov114-Isochrysis_galbana.AAC.15
MDGVVVVVWEGEGLGRVVGHETRDNLHLLRLLSSSLYRRGRGRVVSRILSRVLIKHRRCGQWRPVR